MLPELSVIIPIKDEMSLGYMSQIIQSYSSIHNIELIWVSGNSTDGSVDYLKTKNQNVIETNINSRGGRLNKGIYAAESDFILLNHPRSVLSASAVNNLLIRFKKDPLIWGGFTHKFKNNKHWLLLFTSFYSNKVRFDLRGIIYLDHCIFFNKKLLMADKKAVPEVDIFEDTLFSKKLLKIKKHIRLKDFSVTSPVRFKTNGIYKQSYLNQKLKWQFYFGRSLTQMNKKYEEGLGLNSNY